MKSETRLILILAGVLLAGVLCFGIVSMFHSNSALSMAREDAAEAHRSLAETQQQFEKIQAELAEASEKVAALTGELPQAEKLRAEAEKALQDAAAKKQLAVNGGGPAQTTPASPTPSSSTPATAAELEKALQEAREENALLRRRYGMTPITTAPAAPEIARSPEGISRLPWPPPQPSSTQVLPQLFSANLTDFGDLDRKLVSALHYAGYSQRSYYAIPNGFALATSVEQFNPDGTSKLDPERWFDEVEPAPVFSPQNYLSALFVAPAGRYRVVVFTVTTSPVTQSNAAMTKAEAQSWSSTGTNTLPSSIATQRLSNRVKCTALVYEFVQDSPMHAARQIVNGLSAETHLQKSRILAGLQ